MLHHHLPPCTGHRPCQPLVGSAISLVQTLTTPAPACGTSSPRGSRRVTFSASTFAAPPPLPAFVPTSPKTSASTVMRAQCFPPLAGPCSLPPLTSEVCANISRHNVSAIHRRKRKNQTLTQSVHRHRFHDFPPIFPDASRRPHDGRLPPVQGLVRQACSQ